MKKRILVVIFIITLIIIAVGFTYAFFTANITGNESSSTLSVSGGVLSLTVDGGNLINVQNIIPSNEEAATKTITLTSTNTTDLAMPYTLSLVVVSNTFSDNVISFSLDSTNTDNNGSIVKSISEQSIAHGSSIISLGSGYFNRGNNKVHTYILKIYFKETGSNQNIEQGNEIRGYMSINSSEARLPEELLQMNVIYEPNEDLTYTKNKSIKVSASNDLNNIDESSLKYLWSPISNITDSTLITNTFTNGSNISTPVITGEYYLYTLVRDQNDNEEIHRSDIYKIDNQAPIITLNGSATVNIITGNPYSEQGATASDVQDGDLTSQISTSGSVNTSSPGTYTVTYSVSDLSGNSSTIYRTVIVANITLASLILGENNVNVTSPLTTPGVHRQAH